MIGLALDPRTDKAIAAIRELRGIANDYAGYLGDRTGCKDRRYIRKRIEECLQQLETFIAEKDYET